MKFLHISDLHIGKTVNDFSLLEDQRFMLRQIRSLTEEKEADALVIAGDVYDRAIPPAEAVALFDGFLTELNARGIPVLMIAGNHDSPERLSFGAELLRGQGVYIGGGKEQEIVKVNLRGIQFVLLPFLKPSQAGAKTTQEAVEMTLKDYWEGEKRQEKEKSRVLVSHFFVTDGGTEPELSDSEATVHVGGLDNVDASVFQGFDYVALGHIHRRQRMGRGQVWYSGSPLAYSFGEAGQTKTALLVEIKEGGVPEVTFLPLKPLREMRKIRGSLRELLEKADTDKEGCQDYIQVILTDKGELLDPMETLRSVYPNVMQIVREENPGTDLEDGAVRTAAPLLKRKDTAALFADFYREVSGEELSPAGQRMINEIIKEAEI